MGIYHLMTCVHSPILQQTYVALVSHLLPQPVPQPRYHLRQNIPPLSSFHRLRRLQRHHVLGGYFANYCEARDYGEPIGDGAKERSREGG